MPASRDGGGPAEQVAHAIKPWISWLILPLFGVVNAGVSLAGFTPSALLQPVTLGIAAGLLLGKPAGILLGTWVASRFGGGLPDGLRLRDYVPVACFCGIGFTMALFIATLSFAPGTPAAIRCSIPSPSSGRRTTGAWSTAISRRPSISTGPWPRRGR